MICKNCNKEIPNESTMAFVIMEVEEPFTKECFVLNYENNTISVKGLDDKKVEMNIVSI